MGLRQLVQAHHEGQIPTRAVALTFDDGYANNFYNAKPLLERYDIPATVFVISGYIARNQEFWWDELEQVLLQPGKLPSKLYLPINDTYEQWDLGKATKYSEADRRSDYDLYASNAQPGSRLSFYHSVWQQLRPLKDEERREALAEIKVWADKKSVARPTHRPLTSEEVCLLEQGGLIEVGAHTVSHILLPDQSIGCQRDEIRQCKTYLEDVLGHLITSFSYPYGSHTEETITLVRNAGFNYACTTIYSNIRRNPNLFQLPRFGVGNWSGAEFEKRLLGWLHS
jgi:peptidoglycan/xylan/chitin deacetylase (PgdA/CDA1 family)